MAPALSENEMSAGDTYWLCESCDKYFSDRYSACPHCAYPVYQHDRALKKRAETAESNLARLLEELDALNPMFDLEHGEFHRGQCSGWNQALARVEAIISTYRPADCNVSGRLIESEQGKGE